MFILSVPRTIFIFFCTLSFFFTLSCTSKGSDSHKGELRVALSSAPATLDPRKATDATGMRLSNLIFQSLVRVNKNLEVEGDAASTWSFKDKTYFFQVPKGILFHNGRALTKEDLAFSFDEFRSKNSPFSSAFAPIESVEIKETPEGFSVAIHVSGYSAKFLSSDLPVLKILPKKEVLESGESFKDKPMGSGPLKVDEIGVQNILLERAQPLSEDSTLFRKFNFKVIKDDFTRSQKLLKGELDIAIAELPPDMVRRLEKQSAEELTILTYPGLSMTYLLMNLKDKTLADKNVRKALNQALNREEIIQHKLLGLGQAATSILTPNNPFFNGELKNPEFDLGAAQKVLKNVGTLSLKTSSNPTAIDHGKVLANQLEQAGLKINLQSFEWGTFYNDVKTGNFQLATMKWVGAFDPDIYRIAFHSKELPPGRNRSNYINSELDPLLDKAFQIEDLAERKKVYLKIQKMVFDDFAILPLWYETQAAVLRKGLEGFETSPLSDYYGLLQLKTSGNANGTND